MIRRPMRSATRGADPRVEVGGDVERKVAWAGASGRVAVVQVEGDVVHRPVGTPGRGSPVIWTEFPQDRDEPSPLLTEHLEDLLRVQVARAPPSAGAVRLAGCFPATGRGRLPMPPWCFRGGLLFPDRPGLARCCWLRPAPPARARTVGIVAGGDGAAHARSEGRRQVSIRRR